MLYNTLPNIAKGTAGQCALPLLVGERTGGSVVTGKSSTPYWGAGASVGLSVTTEAMDGAVVSDTGDFVTDPEDGLAV